MKIVAVSGGFDPIHDGHIQLFKEAGALGDKLVVILNNDNWLFTKKGYVFMSEEQRKVILEAIKHVDEIYLTKHKFKDDDVSVCDALKDIKPDVFANGGDRFPDNIPEYKLCEESGIKMVFNVGGKKVESSSNLVKKYMEEKENETKLEVKEWEEMHCMDI